jgi:hypothetical protein
MRNAKCLGAATVGLMLLAGCSASPMAIAPAPKHTPIIKTQGGNQMLNVGQQQAIPSQPMAQPDLSQQQAAYPPVQQQAIAPPVQQLGVSQPLSCGPAYQQAVAQPPISQPSLAQQAIPPQQQPVAQQPIYQQPPVQQQAIQQPITPQPLAQDLSAQQALNAPCAQAYGQPNIPVQQAVPQGQPPMAYSQQQPMQSPSGY